MTAVAEKQAKISIADFLDREDFEEGYIYELINGEIMRRQSPNTLHQKVVGILATYFNVYILPKKLGHIYPAPTDVYLDEDANLVVPDLNYVSAQRAHIVQPSGYILGTPDIIVEILSKGTRNIDRGTKMQLYKYHRVPEYWIVDPLAKAVEVYVFQKNDYELVSVAEESGEVSSVVLEGFKLEVSAIFE
jgi:Uma2 family endonuclease